MVKRWFDGLGIDEVGGLGLREEHGVVFVDVFPISIVGGGLHPCRFILKSKTIKILKKVNLITSLHWIQEPQSANVFA